MMEHFFISGYVENFSYIGTFIIMALAGTLVPVPEEVVLLLIGYASGVGISNVYISTAAAAAGVVAGDSMMYLLSRTGNKYIEKIKRRLNRKKLDHYERLMRSYAGKTIFISRFIVTLRFFSPLLAGSLKIKWKTFQLYNTLAVAIYVPVLIFLGYHFHNEILKLITHVEIIRHVIFTVLVIIAGSLVSYHVGKHFLTRNNGDKSD